MREFLRQGYVWVKKVKSQTTDNLFGKRDYKKFVIISDSRTGSTLLMELLNSHPEIICLGEEFKYLNGSSCEEKWRQIFRKRPKSVKWVGFKLFYTHPSDSKDRAVWDFIENERDMVIIHLTRRNILRSYVSKQIGLKTRKWTESVRRPHKISESEKTVQLDFQKCLESFQSISYFIGKTEKQFEKHKTIPIIYEDLDKDKQMTMNGVYKTLDVSDFVVATNMMKQNPEPLENLVTNYFEIREKFMDTKWEYLFTRET